MVTLRCPTCGHVWVYTGSRKYYAVCPVCHRHVHILKYRVDREQEEAVGGIEERVRELEEEVRRLRERLSELVKELDRCMRELEGGG